MTIHLKKEVFMKNSVSFKHWNDFQPLKKKS